MRTIKAFIRVSPKRKQVFDAAVRFRISDGRSVQLFYTSSIYVDPKVWDSKSGHIKAKVLYSDIERKEFDNSVDRMKTLLLDVYDNAPNKESLTSKDFVTLVDMRLHPERYDIEDDSMDFFKAFDKYLFSKGKDLSPNTLKECHVTYRCLQRFQLFKAIVSGASFKFDFDSLDAKLIEEFEDFLKNEHRYCAMPKYRQVYESVPEKRTPKQRGRNTICCIIKKFRAFIMWAVNEGLTDNDPFRKYTIKGQIYGTPYYITIDERNQIADADLSALWEAASEDIKKRIPKTHIPQLAIQRDIFVFQCLVGCRVSDLYSLTPAKVVGDTIQYIAGKTKGEQPNTIVVPLNSRAKEILARYYDGERTNGALFPFIAQQRYNDSIKDIFTLVGITRMVTILNTITDKEEQHPINEVASSHMARRTFVGNAYKKFKDPALVGSMSGHVDGSRSFARYRDIDLDIKKEVVKELE